MAIEKNPCGGSALLGKACFFYSFLSSRLGGTSIVFPPLTREMLSSLNPDPKEPKPVFPIGVKWGHHSQPSGVVIQLSCGYLQSLILPQFLRERGNGKTHYARLRLQFFESWS
mgnify:CR=1 FL=1